MFGVVGINHMMPTQSRKLATSTTGYECHVRLNLLGQQPEILHHEKCMEKTRPSKKHHDELS